MRRAVRRSDQRLERAAAEEVPPALTDAEQYVVRAALTFARAHRVEETPPAMAKTTVAPRCTDVELQLA
jgi:hypothetical protein